MRKEVKSQLAVLENDINAKESAGDMVAVAEL